MKKIFAFAFALVALPTLAQSSKQQQLDPHLKAVITLNDCCIETKEHDDGFVSYKFYGYDLIDNFLVTMKENYPRFIIISDAPKMVLFTDTNDRIGVATVLETPYHATDMMEIFYKDK